MSKLILGALACAAFAGCMFTPCPAIDCADQITISVKDASGQPLSTFSGKVTMQGREIQVACGGAQAGDGGVPDGGAVAEQAGCGSNGTFNLFGGAGSALTADLHSGSLSFNGPVTITEEKTPVGDARCNNSCTSGTGSVTLQ